MKIISLLSTIVTIFFTIAVYRRYRKKGGLHLLYWSVGLLLYAFGTLSEVVLGFVFNELMLKLWYLSGAMLTAAWLGQGSIQLLLRKGRWSTYLAYALGVVSLLALYLVMTAPLTGAQVSYNTAGTISEQYKAILTRAGLMVFLTIILNIYGTIGLVGGAGYSAYLFWRKQVLAGRMFGNILIALGALAPAFAGTLVKAGMLDALYVSELLGAILMFAGFIMATSGKQ